ncbi:hypothetical protein LLG96_04225 [bacterium]|nr:hypothetical protein [bacterium]
MLETFRKGLSEKKFQRIESEVREEVAEKYGENNPMHEKLAEIALNNKLAKLAAIPSLEAWSKSDADVGAPTRKKYINIANYIIMVLFRKSWYENSLIMGGLRKSS